MNAETPHEDAAPPVLKRSWKQWPAGVLLRALSLLALLIGLLRRLAIWIATQRFYLFGFIPSSAGLWPLGLWCWHRPVKRWFYRLPLRAFSYLCFLFGTILFFKGLWRFALILFGIRILIWVDAWWKLGKPLSLPGEQTSNSIFRNPLDRVILLFIGTIFLIFAINKDRLAGFLDDPSDNYYHMAVAQKILERGEIPIWDDWEFAPSGRPHLYPPLLHLLIAFFAGAPDKAIEGLATVQMLLFPSALFCYWLLFRRWLGVPLAFLSLIFLSMEMMFMMGCIMGLPASLANVLWPLMLLAFLNKRTWLATLLLGAVWYTHTGMPMLISLGLLVFGIWKREHFRRAARVVAGAFLLSLPWTVRYVAFSDWMHPGGAQGFSPSSILARLFWLQNLNLLFIALAIWGWFRCKEEKMALVKSQVLGFLPMLTQYGGRFFMHGAPFLSPLIAWTFRRWVTGSITRRRVVALFLMTLIPLPCVNFFGEGYLNRPKPFVNITATHIGLVHLVNRKPKDTGDTDRLVEVLRNTTSPNAIIHLPDAQAHFGDMLVVRTGRRVDSGGWGEVRSEYMSATVEEGRKDRSSGVFVVKDKEKIPEGYRIEKAGKHFIGYPQPQEEGKAAGDSADGQE